MLNGNLEDIQDCAIQLGVEPKHAGILACMIASKPWSAIERGLTNVPDEATKLQEKSQLRKDVSEYMTDITRILATVDRQLLLVMKTNDLIRSICHYLGTDERRAYLTMTQFCVQVSAQERLEKCTNFFSRFITHFQIQWIYFKLSLYSIYLRFSAPSITRTVSKFYDLETE